MLAVEMLDVLFGDAVKYRFELHESTVKLPLVSWSATLYQRVSEEGIVRLYFLHPTTHTHTHTHWLLLFSPNSASFLFLYYSSQDSPHSSSKVPALYLQKGYWRGGGTSAGVVGSSKLFLVEERDLV